MKKRNFLVIMIIVIAALLIALVVFTYERRIENEMKNTTGSNAHRAYRIRKNSYAYQK